MKKESIMSIALICVVLGFMLAVQFKTTAANPKTLSMERVQDMVEQLDTVTQKNEELADEVVSLRQKLAQAGDYSQAMEALGQELKRVNMLSGLEPVKGPGLIVTLTDSTQPLQPGENPNLYTVHDEDILKVVNELRAGGAEAIAVNEQRLIATSEIRCAGPTVLVNTNRIAHPFVIKAIGNPETLEASLRMRGGHLEFLDYWGVKSQLKKVETMELPAYKGALKFQFAEPVNSNEKAE